MPQTLTRSKTPDNPEGRWPTHGPDVCNWIEGSLVHGEGDFFGQPFRLTPSQRAFIWRLYEYHPETGRRRYRRVLLGLPKGNGKTEIGAAIVCVELAMRPFGGVPNIPVAAASWEQADLPFGAVKNMISEGPLSPYFDVYDTEVVAKADPGRAYRVAAMAGTNDGPRATMVLADEVHEWVGSKERVHLVLTGGLTKRINSFELNISTAGWDMESLLGTLYVYGKKVQSGEIKDDAFLMDWTEAPADIPLTTPEEVLHAVKLCNPGADIFWPAENVVRRFYEIPEFEFRRYHLNQWTKSADSWFPLGAWHALKVDEPIPFGAEVYIGVDVGIVHDSTAVVVAYQRPDGRVQLEAKVWSAVDNVPAHSYVQSGRIDLQDVEQHIVGLTEKYQIRELVYDPRFFERSAQELAQEGIWVAEMPSGAGLMRDAEQGFYMAVREGQVAHDGDEVLAAHVEGTAAEPTERGWKIRKLKSSARIDATVASVMAYSRAERAVGGYVITD